VPRAARQRGEHEERLPRHGPDCHPANIMEIKILVDSRHRFLAALTPCEQAPQIRMSRALPGSSRKPPAPGA
jgi:hypothetical protein